ncbi:hypothetical protein [Mucilaginibacter arboris]|uniref:Uncharacterized protein n=1 Tax=Mucilaginibacter arboris TaxID=2682090 RepID=A0A7K1SVU6_9SPHI|nr:hypothetical protein [Mucilaginibacter arboris]MVN21445.1 hypothetical protein [Mucilaginibacter arboris]
MSERNKLSKPRITLDGKYIYTFTFKGDGYGTVDVIDLITENNYFASF